MTPDPGEIVLSDMDATRALAQDALRRTGPGSLLILTGPLGSGKTTFTSLLARELGAAAAVTSPTYTLVHEYPTPQGVLVHVDAYRLPDAAALEGLGLDAYLERARLVVVEWGEGLLAGRPEASWLAFSWKDVPPTSNSVGDAREVSDTGEAGEAGEAVAGTAQDGQVGGVVRTARWMRSGPAAGAGA
ncbi:MAG: tRNA (adenosine(37)-N6)-threonylcarbamoyltransferase complex ATPase subunit type 1 TsaE [Trueperaceae bacterium]